MFLRAFIVFSFLLSAWGAQASVNLEGIDSFFCPMAQLNWDKDKVFCQARDSYPVARGHMFRRLSNQEVAQVQRDGIEFKRLKELNLEPEGFISVYNQFYLIQDSLRSKWGVANLVGGRIAETNERVDLLIRYNLYGEIVVVEDLNAK